MTQLEAFTLDRQIEVAEQLVVFARGKEREACFIDIAASLRRLRDLEQWKTNPLGWVSVEDRVPDSDRDVLVWWVTEYRDGGFDYEIALYDSFGAMWIDPRDGAVLNGVTHWAELQPPEIPE